MERIGEKSRRLYDIMFLYDVQVPTRTLVQIRTHAQKYFQKNDFGMKYDRVTDNADHVVDQRRANHKVGSHLFHTSFSCVIHSVKEVVIPIEIPINLPHALPLTHPMSSSLARTRPARFLLPRWTTPPPPNQLFLHDPQLLIAIFIRMKTMALPLQPYRPISSPSSPIFPRVPSRLFPITIAVVYGRARWV